VVTCAYADFSGFCFLQYDIPISVSAAHLAGAGSLPLDVAALQAFGSVQIHQPLSR
jgi:hypothetical protein